MEDMNRREFMAAALGGMAALHGAGVSGLDRVLPSPEEVRAAVLLRRNVYCMSASSPQIVAYRNAITAMKALPASNGTSWNAQANIHGATSPPPGMIVNACQHGNLFFLSWHRMYLYFFERIVRHKSGDPNFALPYWGYSPSSPTRRVLPAMFRTPSTAANVLFVSNRSASINAGNPLTASTVDPGPALLQLTFNPFSSSLEGTPHGVVHNGVGGGMSSFSGAGRDPIFWLHHAMVDRLWEVWLGQGGGRANPTTASWLNTSFNFYDENGATVSMTGAQVVNTATQLNYRYANPICLRELLPIEWTELTSIPRFDPRALRIIETLRVRPPLPDPPPPIVAQESLRLGPAAAEVRVPVSADAKRALERFQSDSPGGGAGLNLVLDEIRVEPPVQVFYEVYVNLPPGTTNPVYTSPHYVGNLDFFGASPQEGQRAATLRRTLSLIPAYARLRAMGRWSDDVRVTLVPRAYTENEVPGRLLAGRTQAVIGRVSLRIE